MTFEILKLKGAVVLSVFTFLSFLNMAVITGIYAAEVPGGCTAEISCHNVKMTCSCKNSSESECIEVDGQMVKCICDDDIVADFCL